MVDVGYEGHENRLIAAAPVHDVIVTELLKAGPARTRTAGSFVPPLSGVGNGGVSDGSNGGPGADKHNDSRVALNNGLLEVSASTSWEVAMVVTWGRGRNG